MHAAPNAVTPLPKVLDLPLFGSAIGLREFVTQYLESSVQAWSGQMLKLSEIAISQPQAAYSTYRIAEKFGGINIW